MWPLYFPQADQVINNHAAILHAIYVILLTKDIVTLEEFSEVLEEVKTVRKDATKSASEAT